MLLPLLSPFTSRRLLRSALRPRLLFGLLVGAIFAVTSLGCSSYSEIPQEDPAGRRPGPAPVEYRYMQPRQSFVLSPVGTSGYRGVAAESQLYARAEWPVPDELTRSTSLGKTATYREYFYSDDRTGSSDRGYYRRYHRVIGTGRYTQIR